MKKIILLIMLLLSGVANANRLYSNIAMGYVWNDNHTELVPQYITTYRNIGAHEPRLWALLLNDHGSVTANIELPSDITSINRIITTDSFPNNFILAGTGGLVYILHDGHFHELPLLGYEIINVLKTRNNPHKFVVIANRLEPGIRDSVSFEIYINNNGSIHDMGDDKIISNKTIFSAASTIGDIDNQGETYFFASSGDFIYRKVGNGNWLRIETPSEYSSFNFLTNNCLPCSSLLLAYNTADNKWYRDNFRGSSKNLGDFLPVFTDQRANVGLDYFSHAVSPYALGGAIVSLNNSQDNLQTVVNYIYKGTTSTFSENLPPHGGSINIFHTLEFGDGDTIDYNEFSPGTILFMVRNRLYVQDFFPSNHSLASPHLLSILPD